MWWSPTRKDGSFMAPSHYPIRNESVVCVYVCVCLVYYIANIWEWRRVEYLHHVLIVRTVHTIARDDTRSGTNFHKHREWLHKWCCCDCKNVATKVFAVCIVHTSTFLPAVWARFCRVFVSSSTMCGAGSVPSEGPHRAAHTGAHTSLGGCSAEHVNHLHELNTTSIALLWNPSVCFVKRFTVACVGGAAGELSSYV